MHRSYRLQYTALLKILYHQVRGTVMPNQKSRSDVLVALNQAFLDHVRDEERRFDEMATALRAVGALNATLSEVKIMQGVVNASVQDLVVQTKEQNGRIGKLERWRSWLLGILLILGIITGYVAEHAIEGIFHPSVSSEHK